ncbi:MAG: hypothetical protein IJL06_00215 [Kiritimatiellae bacterium]|nr:hypothetical protein [Kiritimatiellia bacterium]
MKRNADLNPHQFFDFKPLCEIRDEDAVVTPDGVKLGRDLLTTDSILVLDDGRLKMAKIFDRISGRVIPLFFTAAAVLRPKDSKKKGGAK